MTSRARPLPPDERRAALIAATVPLISEHGPSVTTRQIASAAGVAEGTIFGVFPDKDTLIRTAVHSAFDPDPVVASLTALAPGTSLEERLTTVVEILQERLMKVFRLISTFGMHQPPPEHDRGRHSANAAILEALTNILAVHADSLRIEPAEAARILRLVVFAGSHPRITDENPLSTKDIVDLLLHGIVKADAAPPSARRQNPGD